MQEGTMVDNGRGWASNVREGKEKRKKIEEECPISYIQGLQKCKTHNVVISKILYKNNNQMICSGIQV